VAQCVWWLASIVGLEQGLVNYINNLQSRINVTVILEQVPSVGETVSPVPKDNQEDRSQDKILKECEEYLRDSKRLRDIAALKATGKTLTGFINPTAISKKRLGKKDQTKHRLQEKRNEETKGIQPSEIKRRHTSGECQRCAWPADRIGAHRVADCRRPINLDTGTADFPKAKEYLKAKQAPQRVSVEEENSETSSFEESSDDSL
jgi:hypothetical protein